MRFEAVSKVLAIHVGFHSIWVLIYLVSLTGVFILIPFVGMYNSFILGFLGKTVLVSPTRAVMFGYLVFALTGCLSGIAISQLRVTRIWIPGLLSLLVTVCILVGVSWLRHAVAGAPWIESGLQLPRTTGIASVDRFSMALKSEYHRNGEVPPSVPGKPRLLPLAELLPQFELLDSGFRLSYGPHVYCNLEPSVWRALRRGRDLKECPIVWSERADLSGRHLVVSVDLSTDIFSDELVGRRELSEILDAFERAIQRQTGDAGFRLSEE
jgi:hypothetical protein